MPQDPLGRRFRTQLRNDDQRLRSTRARELDGRAKHLARHLNALANRRIGAIRHEQTGQRREARCVFRREPRQSRTEMRSVVVEIAAEQRGHEQRHDCNRLSKARQLCLEPQVRLVGTVPVDRKVCGLDAEHRADLGRHRFVPRQSLAKHHRLAGEQERRRRRIDRFVETPDAISRGIDRVFDGASADDAVAGACGVQHPAQSRIGTAARLFLGQQPFGRPEMHAPEDQFARAERQDRGDADASGKTRLRSDNPPDRPAREKRERIAGGTNGQAHERLQPHVPVTRHEERRQEMSIEPGLVRRDGAHDERRADDRRRDLYRETTERGPGRDDAVISKHERIHNFTLC